MFCKLKNQHFLKQKILIFNSLSVQDLELILCFEKFKNLVIFRKKTSFFFFFWKRHFYKRSVSQVKKSFFKLGIKFNILRGII
ncbi:hypothetical protein C4M89_00480 [Mycoplasmopsis pullorum]|nr:hypothetical protein C4M89_00480 [Mycoplasmopsis pullorum]